MACYCNLYPTRHPPYAPTTQFNHKQTSARTHLFFLCPFPWQSPPPSSPLPPPPQPPTNPLLFLSILLPFPEEIPLLFPPLLYLPSVSIPPLLPLWRRLPPSNPILLPKPCRFGSDMASIFTGWSLGTL